MDVVKRSADLPSLNDIKVDLGRADKEAGDTKPNTDADELPDIPTGKSEGTEKSKPAPAPTEAGEGDFDFGQGGTEQEPEDDIFGGGEESTKPPAFESEPKNNSEDTETKVKEVVNEIDKAKVEVEITTLKLTTEQLRNENTHLHTQLKELNEKFNDHVLFRIPKYQEIQLPSSRRKPEYIVPHIGNALDKLFIKIFRDVPEYDFKKFDVIDKESDGNIVNANMIVGVSFHDTSPFKMVKFDLELWIIQGFLQIPQWFVYNKQVFPLTEEGIKSIDTIANRLDPNEARNRHDANRENWYTVNRDQKNPSIPSQVEIPESQHTPQNVYQPHRPY